MQIRLDPREYILISNSLAILHMFIDFSKYEQNKLANQEVTFILAKSVRKVRASICEVATEIRNTKPGSGPS